MTDADVSDEARDPRLIVRARLATGKLPRGGEARLTLNLGPVRPCDGCGSPITGMECIAELHDDRKLHFHGLCVEVWQSERGARGDRAQLVAPQPDWEGNLPHVMCIVCGLPIRPFDGRFVSLSGSFHPGCYDRMQEEHSEGA